MDGKSRKRADVRMMTGVTQGPKGPVEWVISVEGALEAGIHPSSGPRDRDRGVSGNRHGLRLATLDRY